MSNLRWRHPLNPNVNFINPKIKKRISENEQIHENMGKFLKTKLHNAKFNTTDEIIDTSEQIIFFNETYHSITSTTLLINLFNKLKTIKDVYNDKRKDIIYNILVYITKNTRMNTTNLHGRYNLPLGSYFYGK